MQELASSQCPAVRNNALIALCDICQQSTSLVDTHLRQVAAGMRDPHPLLRKQALALLAGLLQKEFVKWRGPLFVQYAPLPSPAACAEFVPAVPAGIAQTPLRAPCTSCTPAACRDTA